MSVPVFTALACGNIVDVSVNTTFAIELKENPTTGYRWEFQADPGLEVVSSSYILNPGGDAGGGGVRRLLVRSNRQGDFVLHGKLWRSWLGDSSTITRCEITVRSL
jgi:inhibitor of cysteine peptidase